MMICPCRRVMITRRWITNWNVNMSKKLDRVMTLDEEPMESNRQRSGRIGSALASSLDEEPMESNRQRSGRIGSALAAYLESERSYGAMMRKEQRAFDSGRRHLANIMGLDADYMTQADIDQAVAYLFPSGLTSPSAQPVMRPPEEIVPRFRSLHFDDEARPRHSLFFTLRPNFYALLSSVGQKAIALLHYGDAQLAQVALLHYGDAQLAQGIADPPEISIAGTNWLSKEQLTKRLEEMISDEMYAQLLTALEHLLTLPYAVRELDFIMSLRVTIGGGLSGRLFGPGIPEVEVKDGRRIARAHGIVKASVAEALVIDAGSGQFVVDGHPLEDFRSLQAREIFLAPLLVTDLLGKVDVEGKLVEGPGGGSSLPRAVRHATSLCLAALYPEMKERLRLGESF